jgi:hypothetical protein
MSSNARSTPRSGRVSLAAAFILSCDIVASIWWLRPGASPTPGYLPIAIMSGIFDPTFSVPLAQILEQGKINVVSSRTDPGSTRLARLLRAAG